ncbi:MAG: hypothetical protein FRX49_05318 [Trebouxia sp. A1-2]|nr:MAG: hypothetical protein FRX49_05318 [Trebouxia sp. A1-2]
MAALLTRLLGLGPGPRNWPKPGLPTADVPKPNAMEPMTWRFPLEPMFEPLPLAPVFEPLPLPPNFDPLSLVQNPVVTDDIIVLGTGQMREEGWEGKTQCL